MIQRMQSTNLCLQVTRTEPIPGLQKKWGNSLENRWNNRITPDVLEQIKRCHNAQQAGGSINPRAKCGNGTHDGA